MKKDLEALENVKKKINLLKGTPVQMEINRGRNKIEMFEAIIDCVYPSVFTVKVDAKKQQPSQTFSYFDVLCGEVKIF